MKMANIPRLAVLLLLPSVLVIASEGAAAVEGTTATATGDGDGQTRFAFTRIFCFGNSLTDTGNGAILPATAAGPTNKPPYGNTYFHRPTGRASDGRLIVDFIVEALKVARPAPYLAVAVAGNKTVEAFRRGANFAVGGATALDPHLLKTKGLVSSVPVSLSNETVWYQDVLRLLGSESKQITASSLFYVGEIGVNDYFLAILSNRTIDETASLVPHVVGAIRSAVKAMISSGARTVVVSGMIPLGCEPQLLALIPGGAGGYDPQTGCIARFNDLAELHNRALRRMLRRLRLTHPLTAILYADIYRPVAAAAASPRKYGFGDKPLAACCGGGGGPYNFAFPEFCSTARSTVCADPSKYISWDGIHYTEAANRFISRTMLKGLRLLRSPKAGGRLSEGELPSAVATF